MLNNANTKMIYSKIQKQLFYMIPEKWDSIYLYASIVEKINHLETGELFFYYFPKGILRKNPVNSYEIPAKFNLDEDGYMRLIENLYNLIKQLKLEFQNEKEELWNSITIKIEKFHFTIEFHYKNNIIDEQEQHIIWGYQNLKIPLEAYTKKEKQIILQYLQEEKIHPSKIQIYTEPMYCNHIKNVVQYNREQPEFLTQEQNYTYTRKQSKPLKERKIIKQNKKHILSDKTNDKTQLSIEEQIEQQRNCIRSQILDHN